jgi:hypothetical protein
VDALLAAAPPPGAQSVGDTVAAPNGGPPAGL